LPRGARPGQPEAARRAWRKVVSFDRNELREIFDLYGRKVAGGEWRDYAIDFSPQKAVFLDLPAGRGICALPVEKHPKLARKQGLYSVVTATRPHSETRPRSVPRHRGTG